MFLANPCLPPSNGNFCSSENRTLLPHRAASRLDTRLTAKLKPKCRHIHYSIISLLLCFGCPLKLTTMDAVSATNFFRRIWWNMEVDMNILISTLINRINWIASAAALEQTCARPPSPQVEWIHQIHTAAEKGGSTTMVAVFIGLVVCCGWTRDITSSSYAKNGTKITLRWG